MPCSSVGTRPTCRSQSNRATSPGQGRKQEQPEKQGRIKNKVTLVAGSDSKHQQSASYPKNLNFTSVCAMQIRMNDQIGSFTELMVTRVAVANY